MRMFFGRISRDISGSSCWRRQRFRSAIATAFLARPWPMTNLSSSPTISRGVRAPAMGAVPAVAAAAASPGAVSPGIRKTTSDFLQRDAVVRVDVDLRRDQESFPGELRRGEIRAVLEQRARRGERVGAAGADREDALLRSDEVARAGEEERALPVGDDQERLELAQHLVGPPVLRELDRGALQVPAVLVHLRLEAGEERERVGRGSREARDDVATREPADLRRGLLHDGRPERDLAVGRHRDVAVVAHANDGRGPPFFARIHTKTRIPRFGVTPGGALSGTRPAAARRPDACTSGWSRDRQGRAAPGSPAGPRPPRAGASRTSVAARAA